MPGSDGAWFALAPLLLVIRHTSPRRAFWFGWLSGSVCWLLSLTWLWRLIWNNGPWPLVAIGHVGLALYCGLYTGLFALAAARLWQVVYRNENAFARITTVVIGEPLLWVGAEFLRCTLFSGFAWNALGVTQKDNLGVIQVASIGGVYAVSAIILLMNSAVASAIERVEQPDFSGGYEQGAADLMAWAADANKLPAGIARRGRRNDTPRQ